MKSINKKFLLFVCVVSALGGLLFGYDWVVIGGAKPFYEVYFGITNLPVMQGLCMSAALLGCLLGAMVAGMMADKYGRKPLLIISAILFLVSAIATGLFNEFMLFCIARFIGGVGIGVASSLSPIYIAEISPSSIRGKMVSINQLTIVLGILGAQIVNWLIADPVIPGEEILNTWNGQMGWRWMFWACAVPASAFLVFTSFIPESPRWEAAHGKIESAKKTFLSVGGEAYSEEQLKLVEESEKNEKEKDKGGLAILFSRNYSLVLIIGIVVAVFQQWCGTNVIFNYAQEIFQSAGYHVGDILFNIVITGVANVIFTIVAIFTVDKWGRRSLMLFGAIGLAVIYLILGACFAMGVTGFFMVILVVAAIACYAMSLGPVTWVLLSEIFPNRIRGVAMAVCTFALWSACTILTFTFPILNSEFGSSGTFWIYSVICFLGFIFFLIKLPETKGKSLEELEKKLIKK